MRFGRLNELGLLRLANVGQQQALSLVRGMRFGQQNGLGLQRQARSVISVPAIETWIPLKEREVLARLNVLASQKDGITVVMSLREKALNALTHSSTPNDKDKEELQKLDTILKHWLGGVFCAAAIETKRVTWGTSTGETLEKVADRDMVLQKVRSIRELKRRLDNGRRCMGIFHIGMPNDPLAFVHVALMREIAPSYKFLSANASEAEAPTHAMFYSVNALHEALSGLDMAARVIKCAAVEVKKEFPTLQVFSTLSPIPRFVKWLGSASSKGLKVPQQHQRSLALATKQPLGTDQQTLLAATYAIISGSDWTDQPALAQQLRPALTWLVTHYLVNEKSRGRGDQPLDPVARFHLRNGAMLYRVNWMGNETSTGMADAAGFMVNYLYEFDSRDERAAVFASSGAFSVSKLVQDTLTGV